MQSLRWILWNLSLAAIPVVAAYLLAAGVQGWTLRRRRVPWPAWLPLALIWFAFLPNTCYLLTEWRHFLFDEHFTGLRDAAETNRVLMLAVARQGLFFLGYSGFGVLCFALSIRPIERTLREARVPLLPWAIPFFVLTSLGVYLGLIVRLNSWDLVTRPAYVLITAFQALMNPLLLQTILSFAVLLWLLYETVDIWVDGFSTRMGRAVGQNWAQAAGE
jgi:uncharacterized membrane protein